jgi:CRP-like cAMP-binding protein
MRGLTSEASEAIVARGRRVEVGADEYFFHQGEESERMYLIVTGRVKMAQVTPDGEQVIVNYFGPGDGLGIVVALSEMSYPLSAMATEECLTICWTRDTMLELMQEYPQIALNALAMIAQRFARLQQRYQEMATQRVERRVALTLLRLVRQFGKRTDEGVLIDMPLTREELAQMTGTNLFNVSRILSRWEQLGYISTKRKYICLVNSHELVVIAEDLSK